MSTPDMWSSDPLDPRAAAQAAIRAYCGWHVAPNIRETLIVDGSGHSRLRLPTGYITDIHKVEVDGCDVTDSVRWSKLGILEGVCFPRFFRAVTVDLTHGYELSEVADVEGVLMRAAKRFSTDPTIRSQSVGGASVSYHSDSGVALSHLLLRTEQAALAPYVLEEGP